MPRTGPEFAPQLATLVATAPPGDDWLHEMKFDGYRILAICQDQQVRLLSRNGNDWTETFRAIAQDLARRRLNAVLDGEVAVVLPDGTTSFEALQQVHSTPNLALTYFVFDLLADDGRDLRGVPLAERKERLESILAESNASDRIRYSQHVTGGGPAFFAQACEHGLEGIISKRAGSRYRPGRNPDWVKVKCVRRQEFVIGGFTEPSGSRAGLGAILVGHHVDGDLVFAGKVGTGYTQTSGVELRERLEKLETGTPPFVNPPKGAEARGVHWVAPRLVAEVGYTELTAEGILRHPSFKGLRPDKDPETVVLEEPVKTTPKKGARKSAAKKAAKKSATGAAESAARPPKGKVPVGGILLSSPGRVVYPELGITKLEVASYYEAMGEWLMPHFRDRPL